MRSASSPAMNTRSGSVVVSSGSPDHSTRSARLPTLTVPRSLNKPNTRAGVSVIARTPSACGNPCATAMPASWRTRVVPSATIPEDTTTRTPAAVSTAAASSRARSASKLNGSWCDGCSTTATPADASCAATTHASDQLLKTLETVAIFDAHGSAELRLDEALSTGDKSSEGTVVALHPGSGSESKNWPLNRWLLLAEALATDARLRFLLVGGEADQKRLQGIARALPSDRTTLLFQQPLTHVARELRSAALFVGHDSGISHLAAAIGLRGILLWGPTNEAVWRPRSERFDVIRHPAGIAAIQPDTVHAAIVRRLSAD